MVAIAASSEAASDRSTTTAVTASPHLSSGAPTTQTWAIAGCSAMTSSTSRGNTLNPPVTIMSLTRSTMNQKPSASSRAMSPVRSQPSRNVSAVASGRFQYPPASSGPATQISPGSPGATGVPSSPSSAVRANRVGRPHEDSRFSSWSALAR